MMQIAFCFKRHLQKGQFMKHNLLSMLMVAGLMSCPAFADDMKGMEHGMSNMSMKSSPNAQSKAYDHQFIDTVMQHHQMAMQMSQMSEPKATHPELKSKIRMMMEEQQKEMDELQSLKLKHYADKGEAINMELPGMATAKKMDMHELMEVQGEAFDQKFITMMTQHHKTGVDLAQSEVRNGKQSDVKALAQKIIQSQKKDIADMARIKKEL